MHIAVNLGVQKVASFQVDNLLPEEIDHEINMAVRRFINQRYNPMSNPKGKGFEQSQKRIDDLRTLLEDYSTPLNIKGGSEAIGSGSYFGAVYSATGNKIINLERFKLPVDYMYLINIKSTLAVNCNKPVRFEEIATTDRFLRIPIDSGKPGNVIREVSVANVFGELEVIWSTIGSRTSLEELLNPLMWAEGYVPGRSYQDGLADMFSSSITSDSPHADGNEIYLSYPVRKLSDGSGLAKPHQVQNSTDGIYDGIYGLIKYAPAYAPLKDGGIERKIFESPEVSYKVNRKADLSQNHTKISRQLCKAVQHDDIFALLDDPFNTAKTDNIMYTMQENFVDLYSDVHTIPLNVTIKYLRRPVNVNLAEGIGCELAEHTHHEIVEMTVKSILESFESPRYQTQSGEVLESE
jgi:hypothetical protein